MLILDLFLVAVVLALAVWRLIAPLRRPRLRLGAVALAVALATAQWFLYGFTWQLVPAYVLLALCALPPLAGGTIRRRIGQLSFVSTVIACLGAWILPAVPTLPAPEGPFAVGTEVYRWTDASRDEPRSSDPEDRRSVIAQAWYPAESRGEAAGAARVPYIDGVGAMPARVSGIPSFILRRYDQIATHASSSTPLLTRDTPWPAVIFSPGYGAPRAVYTSLAIELASRGYVVFVLDHPYESGVTQLPNGRVVGTEEHFTPGQSRLGYMAEQQRVRTADIRFVIDQLARAASLSPELRGGVIEASKVAVIGHSFGGAVSAMAMSEDPRVVAAANIDGTPYGDLPDRQLTRPFLLLQSDLSESPHGDLFHNGNEKLLANSTAPAFRYEIRYSNHYSFSDAFFFLAPPGRWLLSRVIGGGRGPAATQQATADILATFLSGPLTGAHGDLATTVARHPDIVGGPVQNGSATSRAR